MVHQRVVLGWVMGRQIVAVIASGVVAKGCGNAGDTAILGGFSVLLQRLFRSPLQIGIVCATVPLYET
jgi:hypothetical protein